MVRLTFFENGHWCIRLNGVVYGDFPEVDRLAAYEDTGLEPEEVMQTKLALEGKLLAEITELDSVPADRVIELLTAEKDGRLVVLPCKVGDTVYQTDGLRVYECKVKKIVFDTDGIAFDDEAIGKYVFLSREEAEAAMKKMKEADNEAVR